MDRQLKSCLRHLEALVAEAGRTISVLLSVPRKGEWSYEIIEDPLLGIPTPEPGMQMQIFQVSSVSNFTKLAMEFAIFIEQAVVTRCNQQSYEMAIATVNSYGNKCRQ